MKEKQTVFPFLYDDDDHADNDDKVINVGEDKDEGGRLRYSRYCSRRQLVQNIYEDHEELDFLSFSTDND